MRTKIMIGYLTSGITAVWSATLIKNTRNLLMTSKVRKDFVKLHRQFKKRFYMLSPFSPRFPYALVSNFLFKHLKYSAPFASSSANDKNCAKRFENVWKQAGHTLHQLIDLLLFQWAPLVTHAWMISMAMMFQIMTTCAPTRHISVKPASLITSLWTCFQATENRVPSGELQKWCVKANIYHVHWYFKKIRLYVNVCNYCLKMLNWREF